MGDVQEPNPHLLKNSISVSKDVHGTVQHTNSELLARRRRILRKTDVCIRTVVQVRLVRFSILAISRFGPAANPSSYLVSQSRSLL